MRNAPATPMTPNRLAGMVTLHVPTPPQRRVRVPRSEMPAAPVLIAQVLGQPVPP
jgi:hypothetical protein